MTVVSRSFHRSALIRASEVEVVGAPSAKVKLLADSSGTGGVLSTVQVTLEKGADGARPHCHQRSTELFYVLKGVVRFLSGSEVLKVSKGDVVIVPPGVTHAFAAERTSSADILIVIAPGLERFDYFRQLTRIAQGKEVPESLGDVQDLYDTYLLNSPQWDAVSK
jgi:quercetin dioxygenase-like cupin family protein